MTQRNRKPLTPCGHVGCRTLVRRGYCEQHQPAVHDTRESAARRGYGYRWNKERVKFLEKHPWCAECQRNGRRKAATEVDHIIPHKGNKKLFWNRSNWQSLCKSCHSRKTARENAGMQT